MSFATEGFAIVRAVLDSEGVDALRTTVDRLEENHPPTPQILYTHAMPVDARPPLGALLWQWRNSWLLLPGESARRHLGAIRSAVRELVGFDCVLFQDVVTVKAPEHRPLPWHQDIAFWPVDRDDGLVAWLALDRVDASNGAVELAVSSHLAGRSSSIDLHTGIRQDGGPVEVDGATTIPALEPGDMLVFHACCWHRSGSNATGSRRRAWALSFVHPATRWQFSWAPRHSLASACADGQEVASWSSRRYRPAGG